MKTKVLFLLSTFFIASQATAAAVYPVTAYTPMVTTNAALSDTVQCQLTNISAKNIATVAKPVIMRLISDTNVVLEEDEFTAVPAGTTIWGTARTGTIFTRCTFTVADKTKVRAGVGVWASDNAMTLFLKAE